jgi:predicted ATPase
VLFGVYTFNLVRTNFQRAEEVAEELLQLGERIEDPAPRMFGHHALGLSLMHRGALSSAHAHFEQALAPYDFEAHHHLAFRYGFELGVVASAYNAWCLWLLGYPDQALRYANRSLALLERINHAFTQARGFYWNAIVHLLRREAAIVRERAQRALASASEHGFALALTAATILEGTALAGQGQHADGAKRVREGFDAYRATGAEFQNTHHLIMLAEALAGAGSLEEALEALADATAQAERSGERYCEAEIHRVRGEVLLAQSTDDQPEAERCFHQALDVARKQEARSLELRAATSLARLWQRQGRPDDARDLLAPVYDWFTEGFDTADLKDAQALLAELAPSTLSRAVGR